MWEGAAAGRNTVARRFGQSSSPDTTEAGRYTELILPEVPSEPCSMKQPYQMKIPEVAKNHERWKCRVSWTL